MMLCPSMPLPEPHWEPEEIRSNPEALRLMKQKLQSQTPPPPPPSRLSFPPPEAAEIVMRRLVPSDDLDEMLGTGYFPSPKALAEEVMNLFGLNIQPRLAVLLWERHQFYSSSAAELVVDDDLKLKGTLYLSVLHPDRYSQSIYAVDLAQIKPTPVDPTEIDATFRSTMVSRSVIEALPVIDFSGDDRFPSKMSCVNLNSRLYFIGGTKFYDDGSGSEESGSDDDDDDGSEESCNVYCIDVATISEYRQNGIEDLLLDRIQVLKPMNRPKPNKYIFVAKDKIYVISSAAPSMRLHRFEVYDPLTNVWTYLPDPPFLCEVNSDVVFNDKKVILGTFQDGFYCFDLEAKCWILGYSRILYPILNSVTPLSHPIKLGDVIYWDSEGNDVACFGPVPAPNSDVTESDMKTLFKDSGTYSKQLRWDIRTFSPECKGATSLQYLGDDTFIYVMSGLRRNPYDPSVEEDTEEDGELKEEDTEEDGELKEACDVRVVVFKVPGDSSDSSGSDGEEQQQQRKFTPQVMHVVELTCKSREGFGRMTDCFTI